MWSFGATGNMSKTFYVLSEHSGEEVIVDGIVVRVQPRHLWQPAVLMREGYWARARPLVEGEKLPRDFVWTPLRGALGDGVDIILISALSATGTDFSLSIEQPDAQVTLHTARTHAQHLRPAAEAS